MSVTQKDPRTRIHPSEDAVFLARDGRRARRLKRAAIVTALLAVLWCVGLGVGRMGFGSLPGIALVKGLYKGSAKQQAPHVPDQVVVKGDVEPQTAAQNNDVGRRPSAQAAAARRRQA